MKTNKIFASIAALFFFSASAFCTASKKMDESIHPTTIESLSQSKSFQIPFTLVHGHFVVVEAIVNGQKLNLLLDEGALETTIDRYKAENLGFSQNQEFLIGNKTFKETPALAEFDSVKKSGLNVDGIVGSSIFDNYDVEYDMVNGLITCRPI